MTTTRRTIKPGKRPVTKAAVETYGRMLALRKPGGNNAQSEKYFEAARELDRLMQRQPWETAVLDVLDDNDGPPAYYDAAKAAEWWEAHAIGVQLQEAAARR